MTVASNNRFRGRLCGTRGFTLIELMIVVALISILAVIAIPSYDAYVLRSNRVAAKTFLNKVALDEQRYYVNNRTYAKLSDLSGYTADTIGIDRNQNVVTAGSGIYDITVTSFSATDFTLKATAKNRQTSDTGCTELTLDGNGAKTPLDCW